MSEPVTTRPQAILQTVGQYYAERLREFGPTPRGVDWSSAESQALRFRQLITLVEPGRVATGPSSALKRAANGPI